MSILHFEDENFSLEDTVDVPALVREIETAVRNGGGWVVLRGTKVTRTVLFTAGIRVWFNEDVLADRTPYDVVNAPRNVVPRSAQHPR